MPATQISQSAFSRYFRARHSLRLHMTCIVLVTVASGVLASKLLFMAHVGNFAIRYPLTVLLSYLAFFACIKLWLMAVAPSQSTDRYFSGMVDLPVGSSTGAPGGSADLPLTAGGGDFAGGGATTDWVGETGATEVAACAVGDMAGNAGAAVGEAASDAGGEAAGAAIGAAGDAFGEEAGIVIIPLIILAVVLVAVFGVSAYLIYEAPVILSEVAFQGLMVATLSRRAGEMTARDWAGSVYRATCKPFLITLGLAVVCGLLLYGFFPGATRIADIF